MFIEIGQALARIPATLIGAKRVTSDQSYIDSTIWPWMAGDLSRWRTNDQAGLVAAYVSMTYICASRIADVCATSQIRHFRRVGSKASGGKRVSRKSLAWMKSTTPGFGPGVKSATYAERAGDVEEVMDSPVIALLGAPNPDDVGIEFHKLRFVNKALAGNAYTLLISDRGGEPVSMRTLFPQWTRVIPGKEVFIEKYSYGVQQAQLADYAPEDVIQFKYEDDPQNPYYGRGPLKAVWNEHQLYISANQKAISLYDNQARPDYVVNLEVPPNSDQIKQLEQSIWKKLQGIARAGQFLIMPSKGTVTPLSFNPKDMGEEDMKKNLGSVIAAAFGVPESIIHLNDANLASATAGNIAFARWGVLPRLISDAAVWTESLLPKFGLTPGVDWLCYDNPVQEDEESRAQVMVNLTNAGLLTINEARSEQGLEPIEGGDEPRWNGRSLSSIDAPPMPNPFGGQANGSTEVPGSTEDGATKRQVDSTNDGGTGAASTVGGPIGFRLARRGSEGTGDLVVERRAEGTMDTVPVLGDRGSSTDLDGHDGGCSHSHEKAEGQAKAQSQREHAESSAAVWLKANTPTLDSPGSETEGPEFAWYRKIKGMFSAQRDAITAKMDATPSGLQYRSYTRKDAASVDRLLKLWGITAANLDKIAEPTYDATKVYVAAGVRMGAKDGIVMIATDYPETYKPDGDPESIILDSTAVSDAVRRQESAYLRGLASSSQTTADGLSSTLADGIEAGETLPKLTARVQEYFDHLTPDGVSFSASRAATIARTEQASAQDAGTIAGWKETDAVIGKRWLKAGGACPVCDAIEIQFNNQYATLDQPFYKVGDTINCTDGSTFNVDYADINSAPAHPNCRCSVVPVVRGYNDG